MLARLDRELVGLEPIKTRIEEIADLLVIDRLRHRFGNPATKRRPRSPDNPPPSL